MDKLCLLRAQSVVPTLAVIRLSVHVPGSMVMLPVCNELSSVDPSFVLPYRANRLRLDFVMNTLLGMYRVWHRNWVGVTGANILNTYLDAGKSLEPMPPSHLKGETRMVKL